MHEAANATARRAGKRDEKKQRRRSLRFCRLYKKKLLMNEWKTLEAYLNINQTKMLLIVGSKFTLRSLLFAHCMPFDDQKALWLRFCLTRCLSDRSFFFHYFNKAETKNRKKSTERPTLQGVMYSQGYKLKFLFNSLLHSRASDVFSCDKEKPRV